MIYFLYQYITKTNRIMTYKSLTYACTTTFFVFIINDRTQTTYVRSYNKNRQILLQVHYTSVCTDAILSIFKLSK